MSPQRRTALVSVFAALVLIALKLAAGIHSGSLGLLSEAAHSGTDLVAALLTFFAIGVAGRPPDVGHPYGHGKAENLAALAEAAILVVAALVIAASCGLPPHRRAGTRCTSTPSRSAVIGIVVGRRREPRLVSHRAARRYQSAALAMNVLHFGSDLVGSLGRPRRAARGTRRLPRGRRDRGALRQRARPHRGSRLIQGNVDVLMDRDAGHRPGGGARGDRGARSWACSSAACGCAARPGATSQTSSSASRTARCRAGPCGRGCGRGGGRACAPGADVIVHVEPLEADAIRERAYAAALREPRVREVHNMVRSRGRRPHRGVAPPQAPRRVSARGCARGRVFRRARDPQCPTGGRRGADASRASGRADCGERCPGRRARGRRARRSGKSSSRSTGAEPRELRLLNTEVGLVAFLTIAMDPSRPLAEAHALASDVEERIRRGHPGFADVVVHTEP